MSLTALVPSSCSITVREAFEKVRSSRIAQLDDRFPVDESAEVIVGKTPYARLSTKTTIASRSTRVRRTLVVM